MDLPIILLVLNLIFSPKIWAYNYEEVTTWCNKTPYPKPCTYFLSNNPTNTKITQDSDFLKISTHLALQRALTAQSNAYKLGLKCRNDLEKSAWSDCLELYEDTIEFLNKTTTTKCTKYDAQTWLSTALTNLETCKTGFEELGVSDYVLPLMSNNVSKLISNTLAVNKVPFSEPSYNKDGFPTWVKPGDRKLLQAGASPASSANVVVAQDGSGNYKTISEAVLGAPKKGTKRYVIYIKAGTYKENVEVGKSLTNLMFVGDGIGKTIVTGSKSVGGGTTTFRSATVAVVGDRFIARDMTFINTAGPQNHQAVALRSGADLSVFYKCSFQGYQDTLYVHSQRQFYRECDIYGTVDFIFGNAAAVLQNCNIYPRDPPNKTNTLTAQGRTDPNQNTGIIIHGCRVTASSELKPVQSTVKTYLGRPWQKYSRTVYMKTFLDSLIIPAGWMEWSGNFALDTLYYGEYMNTGPGSSTANRVKWKGYRVITSATEASQFTVGNFISGTSWLPATGVPFTPGL
ncbi:pectinesterase 2 [Euphorbia lathyris]|uniref:pectinesterase 2 n=1 Tax=Euphorbia lathyris TaxID=212925 RepID=UPI003313DE26